MLGLEEETQILSGDDIPGAEVTGCHSALSPTWMLWQYQGWFSLQCFAESVLGACAQGTINYSNNLISTYRSFNSHPGSRSN